MPRYNVQHPKTKKWRCFSSIVDDWVSDWMDEETYERWRKFEYGERNFVPVRRANQMSLEEAYDAINIRKINEGEE